MSPPDRSTDGHVEKGMEEKTAALREEIGKQNMAAEQLRQSEEQFRLIAENVSDLIAVLDTEGRRLYNSPSYREILGDPVELRGSTSFDEIHPDDRERIRKIFQETVKTGRGQRAEYRFLLRDGSIRYIESQGSAVPDQDRKTARIIVVSRDVTERKRAEEALSESEGKYRSLVSNIPDVSWTLDEKRRFVFISSNIERVSGYSPKEVYQDGTRLYLSSLHPDDRAKVTESFRALFAEGRPFDVEVRAKRKDGEWRWVQHRALATYERNGIRYADGLLSDITERKRVEEALRDSEERYRRLFEVESDAILVIEMVTGRILDANPAALKLYGYSREDFLLLTAGEVFAEIEETQVATSDERAPLQLRWHRKKDGTVFPVEVTRNSFINQGRMIQVAAIRDITERLRAEIERTRLVTAIEQSAEAILITNTNGDIEYVNPAFTRNSGYHRDEVLGRDVRILKSDKQDPAIYQQLWETIRKGEIWRGEIINRRKDGSLYTEEMHIAPVRDALGKVTHFIATNQDVTEHKALEERLQQAAKMEAIGRLAGGVAHDFNNLLTVINGYSELGLDSLNSDDPVRRYLIEIMKAGERAASLTRQLLAFSRQQVLALRVLDLNDAVSNVGEMLHRLIGEDIKLEMVLDPLLGRVKADSGQIEQILMNLVANARDAMPKGGQMVIETTNVELDAAFARTHAPLVPGGYVMLAVNDTGIGMDAETQAHIFEPFYTTKAKDKGTGLGLATVYGIVKQIGGYVWVYSEPGRGSTFKIYLPRAEESGEPVQFPEAPGHPVGASETILLVEDEEAVRSLAARILQRMGYKVLESMSPEDALQISAEYKEPIHLLLTDVVLPRISGRTVAERLAPLRPSMRVLFMSGYTDDSIVRSGVLEATAAFLQKPFTHASLARKVREVLDAGREQSS